MSTPAAQAKRHRGAEMGEPSSTPLLALHSADWSEAFEKESEDEEEEIDVVSVLDEEALTSAQPQVEPEEEEGSERPLLAPVIKGLVDRASTARGIGNTAETAPAPSRFDDDGEAATPPFSIPILDDFQRLVQLQWKGDPSKSARPSRESRLLAATRNAGDIGCGELPPVSRAVAALILPSKSILGVSGTPSKNCKVMDTLLARVHRAMATQARLANTGAILSLSISASSRGA